MTPVVKSTLFEADFAECALSLSEGHEGREIRPGRLLHGAQDLRDALDV